MSSSAESRLTASDDTNFELTLDDDGDEYKYEGVRDTKDSQFILIFVPEEQHFVLHQVDSSFDMNLVETPREKDAAILASEYEQIGGGSKPKPNRRKASTVKTTKKATEKTRVADKPKKKASKREPTPEPEDEDMDDGLTIEYPDGPPPSRFQRSSPLYRRRESSVESDADGDYEDDETEQRNKDVEDLSLPSPVKAQHGKEDEDDDELDLEAELEMALEQELDPKSKGDESSESEEE